MSKSEQDRNGLAAQQAFLDACTFKPSSGGKHTEGPWVAGDCGSVFNADGNKVAGTGMSHFLSASEMDANALLIAAAPEMLIALLDAREYLPSGSPALRRLDAAIAKAEGKP